MIITFDDVQMLDTQKNILFLQIRVKYYILEEIISIMIDCIYAETNPRTE